jgi:hypothetical protein
MWPGVRPVANTSSCTPSEPPPVSRHAPPTRTTRTSAPPSVSSARTTSSAVSGTPRLTSMANGVVRTSRGTHADAASAAKFVGASAPTYMRASASYARAASSAVA